MRLISMGIYFWLVFLWIPIVKNQYNLYNTDRNRNSLLYHDCLRYEVDDPDMFKSSMRYYRRPFQIISYCLRPVGDEIDSNEIVKGNYSSFRFDELNDMNVTAQDLIRWSIPFDLVEDYQEYLVTAKSTLGQQFLNNCSDTWFGLYCQYKADPNLEFKHLVKFIFLQKQTRSYNELFPLEPTRLICYTQLKCDRCLDWREICDGKIDCPIDGVDELNCLDLEINECADNEYRCHNGLCVPETFLHDDSLNPDCLDSTDEYEYKFLSLHSKAYINCYKDPAFRCEESRHPFQLQNFPCGDGQTSRIFQQSCTNKRDTMHFETLLSFEKNMILSSDCWFALYCATSINNLANDECKIFCKILRCTYNLQDKCDSDSVFVFFPQHVILHDHIRFAYLTNKTIQRRQLEAVPLPDYVCYDARRCPFLTSNLHVNGSACKLTTELKVNATFEIDQFFRACPIEYQKDNHTEFQLRSLFQCPNTTKFISKHRLQDGISDCYQNTDENNVDACSLNHKHRFKCRSENKCISPTVVFDYKPHCIGAEDETRFTKVLPSFQDFCDGFKSSSFEPELVDNQNETDETNCEKWPCDNMYTHCDKAWSCLNGTDEAFCEFRSCPKGSLPCVLPYNFTITCLPISRANDGIIDCLGSSDERSYCRSFGYQVLPYRCWNDTTCIPADNLCQKQQCPFDNIESQCQNKDILNSFDSLNRDVDHVAKPRQRYFSVVGTAAFPHATNITRLSASMKPIMKRALVSHDISTENDVFSKLDPWKCNRGIPIEMGTENNYHCFCPPSYYGDHCQFQSQRVSLTLEMQKICAPDCTGVFGLLVTLFDNKQVIHSQEQIIYISTMDCHRKFNLYLLYSERSKDLNKNYTIRVDAYNKIDMSYHSSWILPVQFAFLPVNRISSLLTVPATAVTSKCSKYCAHGQCSLYINTKQQFCLCESGWSGEHCTMPLNCSCSSDSLCLGTVHNRSTCLCPLNKYGPRCLLSSVCQSNICQKESKICIHDDMNGNIFKCLCRHKFFGDQCENTARMEVSFSELAISQVLLAHFITVTGDTEPERITVLTKIKFDQDEAIFYTLTHWYHLAFVQIQRDYYLAIVSQTAVAVSETKITLDPSRRCPHIRELVDKRTASYPLVRRVKYYHMICGQRLDLFCFHDEEAFMCLCTIERHANCFHFEFNMTYDCHGLNDCQNGAECFTNEGCSTWIMCACPECFYGSKCQFTTKGFTLSLDTILGYSIRPYIPFSRQSTVVKVSITITAIMLFIGLINGIVSTMIFQVKSLRENGCGYYLLASSILSLLIVIVFTLKFVFFLLSQMSILTNRTFLEINCTCMDFLLRSLLAINDWLNASVAIERVVVAIQGTKFNKRKSRRTARFVIPIMAIIVFGSIVHDPIYRELVEDTEEQRSWCIVQYHSFQLELLNSAMNIVHFTLPFSINLISALVIIITVSRQRAFAQKNISYRQHLREQWRHHSHLIFSPIILVLLAIPRLIISFLSGCMKSHRYPGLFLAAYFISFVPPLLTFVVYVVPSKTYKKQFDTLVTQYRTALRRLLNIQ